MMKTNSFMKRRKVGVNNKSAPPVGHGLKTRRQHSKLFRVIKLLDF